jgi:hypothetical protein
VSFHVSVGELRAEVAADRARYVVVFACRDTYFRHVHSTAEEEFSVKFPAGFLRGEVQVFPYISAVSDIKGYRADVRANIIERPTVAQSTHVFSVILKGLVGSTAGTKALFNRGTFRKVMVELNSVGGFKLLDALPEAEVSKIFSDILTHRVGVTAL